MAQIIPFDTNQDMDIDQMTTEQLKQYQSSLLEELAALDAREPQNMASEAYEAWGDDHEELEDLLDEIQDILDQRD